ncbi:MAG: hypothetical protein J0H14_06770 [Alphaproteobacteria bacterium]|nr:hypothetical protein [Rhodospirillales bacterium]MBN9560419.1 hypothetical protein [Alphaproteobacteria bacterium]
MHPPGPWRSLRVEIGVCYTHQIETNAGHIASVVGWVDFGTVCLTTEANLRLIQHAPEMAQALQDLLAWAAMMGGWDGPCWERPQRVLDRPKRSNAIPKVA